MVGGLQRIAIACLFLVFLVQVNGYSKYGRTCRDIGCRSTEKCVMVRECDVESRKCDYPTCVRDSVKLTCATKLCPGGQRCVTEYGEAKCIEDNPNSGYDSAGVSYVNGQRASSNNENNNNNNEGYGHGGASSTHTNPYANANAPPPPPSAPFPDGKSGQYPAYPNSGTNLGYPPYPTQNRMPVPYGGNGGGIFQPQPPPPPSAGVYYPIGNSGVPGNPPYSTNHHQQEYPPYSNYPYKGNHYNAHYPRYKSNAYASIHRAAGATLIFGALASIILATRLVT